jgi:O-acetylhomoserine/O-acetylserine sulfhydrylase-like pyridoxal-dependent enzyme
METVSDADCALTFEIGGVEVDQNAVAATMTVLNADVVGDVHVLDLTPNSTTMLQAAEQDDTLTSGSLLEIVGDAVPSGGTINVVLTIRP